MTYKVSSGTLNLCSLTHLLTMLGLGLVSLVLVDNTAWYSSNAGDTRTKNVYKNVYKLTCASNLHVCHSDLQQDFSCTSFLYSRASFLLEIEHVLFDVLVQVSCTSVTGISTLWGMSVFTPFNVYVFSRLLATLSMHNGGTIGG